MSGHLFGLVGNTLSHSFSAAFFKEKFEKEGIDARYLNFELPDVGDLMELIAEYPELEGVNVTIPYKKLIMPYLTHVSPEASLIGAVNVVRITRQSDGSPTLWGYNTDAPAFARSISSMIATDAATPLNALVLGSGGASEAVCFALRQLGVTPTVVSRTPCEGMLAYSDLDEATMSRTDVIVNTTPLGTFPNVDTCPPIPYDLISRGTACMDLTYNPAETLFMKKCGESGARVKNGADMLRLQALLSWQIWNGLCS